VVRDVPRSCALTVEQDVLTGLLRRSLWKGRSLSAADYWPRGERRGSQLLGYWDSVFETRQPPIYVEMSLELLVFKANKIRK
jgi:hypothetical protein